MEFDTGYGYARCWSDCNESRARRHAGTRGALTRRSPVPRSISAEARTAVPGGRLQAARSSTCPRSARPAAQSEDRGRSHRVWRLRVAAQRGLVTRPIAATTRRAPGPATEHNEVLKSSVWLQLLFSYVLPMETAGL